MRLLLDTHIWIWSLLDPAKLSKKVRAELEYTLVTADERLLDTRRNSTLANR